MPIRMDDVLSIPSNRRIQDTGAMIAECAIARTGNLKYKASELGELFADRDPESIVTVAQLQDNLFSEETIDKFRSAPVTIGHPEDDVNTENMKELSKGMLEGKPVPDGNKLEAHIVLNDKEAIDLVEGGTTELSACAYYNLVRIDDADVPYDAVREVTRVNHIAIVDRGRAGRECKIYDADPFEEVKEPQEPEATKLSDAEIKLADAEAKLVEAEKDIAKQEAKIEDLTTKLADAEAKIPDAVKVDEMVNARLELREMILKVADVDVAGLSDFEAKKAAVEARGISVEGKHDSYVEARFDILLEDSEQDGAMAEALKASITSTKQPDVRINKAEAARERMIKRYQPKEN